MKVLLRAVLQTRRFISWAIALFIVSVALLFVPQFNLLNYYFSLVIAAIAPIGAGFVALKFSADLREHGELRVWSALAIASLVLLAVPLVVVTAGSLWVTNCDPIGGLGHYLMGPVLGSLYGVSAGVLCGLSKTSKRAAAWFIGWWIFEVGANLWHFYNHPPIFAYNPFLGYFNGAVYDDLIAIGPAYYWFRLNTALQIVVFGMAAWMEPRKHQLQRRHGAVLMALLIPLGLLYFYRGDLGFEMSRDDIVEALGGTLETEHFVIHYPKDGPVADRIEELAADHEFRYAQLAALLEVEPKQKITSFIYSGPDQKKALMGAGRTYIAKPWTYEVHLNAFELGRPVLKHELAHVFGAEIAPGIFGIPTQYGVLPKMAIVEGFAVGMTDLKGRLTIHQWSAAMVELGIAPPLDRVLDAFGFLGTHSGQAYTLSGSFIRWLLDTHGLEKLKVLYRTGSLHDAYDQTPQELALEWRRFLADRQQVPLSEANLRLAQYRFDAPSRFHRVCALEIANWEQQAYEAHAAGDHDTGVSLYRMVLAFDPDNPDKRWQLIGSLMAAKALDEALERAEALTRWEGTSRVLATRARGRIADVRWLRGEREIAAQLFTELAGEPMDEGTQRRYLVSARAAGWSDSALGDAVRDYLIEGGGSTDEAVATLKGLTEKAPDEPILHYLLARRYAAARRFDEAEATHARALELGLSSALLERAALHQQAMAALHGGAPGLAKKRFQAARTLHSDQGFKAVLSDWIQRCEWLMARD